MNATLNLVTLPPEMDRRAAALADVKQMHDDLTEAQATILQLRADLHREQDRVTMLIEDRDHHRAEAATARRLLVSLATQMANIGLLTVTAQEILQDLEKPVAPPTAQVPVNQLGE